MTEAVHGTVSGTDNRSIDAPTTKPRLNSHALLRGRRMVEIEHQGEIYRLQITRQGKLILTK